MHSPGCPCSEDSSTWVYLLCVLVLIWACRKVFARMKERGPVMVADETKEIRSEGMGAGGKIAIVVALAVVVGLVIWSKNRSSDKPSSPAPPVEMVQRSAVAADTPKAALPRLVDLGAGKCIPCKMMAPILEELKKEYQGKFEVAVIDVWENPDAGKKYGIRVIPTQIFYDASGKELFRHEGFFSKEDILGKWKEFGIEFTSAAGGETSRVYERLEPAKTDDRPRDQVCYMCDGDIDPKTLVVVKTEKGEVRLCGPHCYFIMYSCLTEDKAGFEKKVSVTNYADGKLLAATDAFYLCGRDEETGRRRVRAFADRDAAAKEKPPSADTGFVCPCEAVLKERAIQSGRLWQDNIVAWGALQDMELSNRCGFCDRAVRPEDAASVRVEGLYTWGCCSHCALGVAARTGKDIEVREKDRLTGEPIVAKTLNGSVASLEPKTAVAWFGLRKGPEGKYVSAGCFHQGFFSNAENLKKWVEEHPLETGKMISIDQALADKMKLTPQQIQKACKIGECAPK